MLREYQIENFKAFAGPETMPIRPITLIYGPNSSGKSSILQSLLLLKQTLDLEEGSDSTSLLPKGALVDLGYYREFVHRHEAEKEFSFKALFTFEKDDETYWLRELLGISDKTLVGLKSRFQYEEKSETVGCSSVEIFADDALSPLLSHHFLSRMTDGKFLTETQINETHDSWRTWWVRVKKHIEKLLSEPSNSVSRSYPGGSEGLRSALENYPFEEALEDLKNANCLTAFHYRHFLPAKIENMWAFLRRAFRKGSLEPKAQVDLINFLPKDGLEKCAATESSPFAATISGTDSFGESFDFDQGLDPFIFSLEICSAFRQLAQKLIYLGPLRSYPERYYTFSGNLSKEVGQQGERVPDLLYQDREGLVDRVNAELKRFGIGYELDVSILKDEDSNLSNVFALRAIDKETGVGASARDVGFGVSQVLPIIVQTLLSQNQNKTLLIEQPEIHLHPALQAELGDLFIKSALGEQKNTFILETHSEHLMLRILRRIRETTEGELEPGLTPIRPEDVAVLYVQPGTDGSKIIEIPIRPDGEFAEQWPQGFFAERAKELF